MQLIDTHSHLTFEPLADDIDGVLERSRAAGVISWITVGTDLEHSGRTVRLAESFEGMYATVGIHPHDAKDASDEALNELKLTIRVWAVSISG